MGHINYGTPCSITIYAVGIGTGAVGTGLAYFSFSPQNENYWMVGSFTDLDSMTFTIVSKVCSPLSISDNTVAAGKPSYKNIIWAKNVSFDVFCLTVYNLIFFI